MLSSTWLSQIPHYLKLKSLDVLPHSFSDGCFELLQSRTIFHFLGEVVMTAVFDCIVCYFVCVCCLQEKKIVTVMMSMTMMTWIYGER